MAGPDRDPTAIVACSVLRAELVQLLETHWPELELRIRAWRLHRDPSRLGKRVDEATRGERLRGRKVLLVYGECFTACGAGQPCAEVVRTQGANCAELLLGKVPYRKLSREGAFFLLPAWAERGARFFQKDLELSREVATSMMRDLHRKLLYLDTGLSPMPEERLEELADYCGLPWEAMPVTLEPLREAIAAALRRLDGPEAAG